MPSPRSTNDDDWRDCGRRVVSNTIKPSTRRRVVLLIKPSLRQGVGTTRRRFRRRDLIRDDAGLPFGTCFTHLDWSSRIREANICVIRLRIFRQQNNSIGRGHHINQADRQRHRCSTFRRDLHRRAFLRSCASNGWWSQEIDWFDASKVLSHRQHPDIDHQILFGNLLDPDHPPCDVILPWWILPRVLQDGICCDSIAQEEGPGSRQSGEFSTNIQLTHDLEGVGKTLPVENPWSRRELFELQSIPVSLQTRILNRDCYSPDVKRCCLLCCRWKMPFDDCFTRSIRGVRYHRYRYTTSSSGAYVRHHGSGTTVAANISGESNAVTSMSETIGPLQSRASSAFLRAPFSGQCFLLLISHRSLVSYRPSASAILNMPTISSCTSNWGTTTPCWGWTTASWPSMDGLQRTALPSTWKNQRWLLLARAPEIVRRVRLCDDFGRHSDCCI